jgi:hypothetical protein
MFANTLDIVVGSNTYTLRRLNQDDFGSEYRFTNGERALSMKIRHSTDKVDGDGLVMKRHNVFLEHIVYPSPTTALKKYTATCTIRDCAFGNPADSAALFSGLITWASSGTVPADLVAGES